jgi:IclR family transcriptional regulator, acetate operon repressor
MVALRNTPVTASSGEGRGRGRLRVTDVSHELHVAPSTAHRLLSALGHYGFVTQHEDRSYVQGPAYARLRMSPSDPETLRLIVSPHLTELSATAAETTHLMIMEGTSIRFIFSAEGPGALRVSSRLGVVLPAHSTSGGKALLAEMSNADLRTLYAGSIPGSSGSKIKTVDDLIKALVVVRSQKFAENIDESEPGIAAVGIALHHSSGAPVAGLSVSVPTVRYRPDHVADLVRQLRQVAARIESQL